MRRPACTRRGKIGKAFQATEKQRISERREGFGLAPPCRRQYTCDWPPSRDYPSHWVCLCWPCCVLACPADLQVLAEHDPIYHTLKLGGATAGRLRSAAAQLREMSTADEERRVTLRLRYGISNSARDGVREILRRCLSRAWLLHH